MEEQVQPQPAPAQPVSTPSIPVRQNFKPLMIVVELVFLLMAGGLVYLGYQNYQLKQQLHQQELTNNSSREITNEVEVPDFSESPVKTQTEFDLATWKTFEDNEVGLRLKYPQEWGSPKRTLDSCTQSCSKDDVTPAWFYKVEFENSQFTIGGASENWAPARGINILYDYRGFLYDYRGFRQEDQKEEFCETPWFLSCEISSNRVTYISSLSCRGESGSGFNYERVMLVDVLNNKKLGGMAFGGNFIPKDSISADLISCEEKTKNLADKALIERRLDKGTMENLDLYNAVFETVEVY